VDPTLCYLLRGRLRQGGCRRLGASSAGDTRWSTSSTPMRLRSRDPGPSQDGDANGSPWLQTQRAGDLRREQESELELF
jgi:hypothetical protein